MTLVAFLSGFAFSFWQKVIYVTGTREPAADVMRYRALWQGRFVFERIEFFDRTSDQTVEATRDGQFFLARSRPPDDVLTFTKVTLERGNPWAMMSPPPTTLPHAGGVVVGVPLWPFATASLAFVIVELRRAWRWLIAARRSIAGRCVTCGFDLRASPDRCPECGTPAPAITSS